MAVTQNTYTGDGLTVLFSFTFPYLETTDIKVSVNGVNTTAYTLANATTVQFNTAPANGAAIRIYRVTDDSQLAATFYPGSAIRSQDLNENFTQNLYVTQESNRDASSAISTANSALAASAAATTAANNAVSTANAANSAASSAVSTANTAASNASSAVTTANAASSAASSAVSTANSASSTATSAAADATSALSAANSAVSTANTASSNASNAVSTANSALSAANSAVSTANAATSTANNALSTANSATSTANAASSTATNADVKADAAIAAVASSVNYTGVANVAAIPSSPANNTYIEILDTTGLESFTPLAGMPTGFVGDSGLKARLRYTTTGSTWNWIDYSPIDADGRYVAKTSISTSTTSTSTTTVASSSAVKAAKDAADSAASAASAAQSTANTAVSNAAAAQSTANSAASAASAAQSTANTAVSDAAAAQSTANSALSTANAALPKAGGTMTGGITFAAGQTFPTSGIAAASTTAPGIVQLNTSTSSTSTTQAATPSAVKSVQDFAQAVSTTANAAMPKAGGTFTGDIATPSINGGPLAGFRNAIINGNFDIWQRGTSFTGLEYGADRWLNARTGSTCTMSRQAFTLGQSDVPGNPIYFCRMVVSSVAGAANASNLTQRIEDVRTFAGQQVTISFWAKADAAKPVSIEFAQGFGTGGSPSAQVEGLGATKVTLSTSWAKYTMTTTLPSVSGKTVGSDNNSSLIARIWFDAGSSLNTTTASLGQQSGTFDIAQVQIEPGPVATPFERRPIGTELALCQRYYEEGIVGGATNSDAAFSAGAIASIVFQFATEKRVAPTMVARDSNGSDNRFNNAMFLSGTPGQIATGGQLVTYATRKNWISDFLSSATSNRFSYLYQAFAEL